MPSSLSLSTWPRQCFGRYGWGQYSERGWLSIYFNKPCSAGNTKKPDQHILNDHRSPSFVVHRGKTILLNSECNIFFYRLYFFHKKRREKVKKKFSRLLGSWKVPACDKLPMVLACERMWDDLRYWLPLVVHGKAFHGRFAFDGDRCVWGDVALKAAM